MEMTVSKLVFGNEKFLVTVLGAVQALLAAGVFPIDPAVNTALIGLIVPLQTWLTANSGTVASPA
jgi:hypothetical protein